MMLRTGKAFVPTFHYWVQTEVHVYAFSIAANVLLSFFPFLIVMISLCRVFHLAGTESAIYLALHDFFPDRLENFVQRNLLATVNSRGPFQFTSVLLLCFTANGIFEPLEVAFNRALGVTKNRSFLRNQLVSLGLIFICGALVMISTLLTSTNTEALQAVIAHSRANVFAGLLFYKAAAIPMSILSLFLIYWLLPNTTLDPRRVIPVAIIVGLFLELLKYINLLTWQWLRVKLEGEYGPFQYSVAIVLWGFLAAMIVLAGAEWIGRAPVHPVDAAEVLAASAGKET